MTGGKGLTRVAHREQLLGVLAVALSAHRLGRRELELDGRVRVDGLRNTVPARAGRGRVRGVDVVLERERAAVCARGQGGREGARGTEEGAARGGAEGAGGLHSDVQVVGDGEDRCV